MLIDDTELIGARDSANNRLLALLMTYRFTLDCFGLFSMEGEESFEASRHDTRAIIGTPDEAISTRLGRWPSSTRVE